MSETQTTTAVSYKTTSTSQKIIPQDTKSQSISNWTENILYARSRNVTFKANMLKPLTKHYAFFDGVSVDQFITSKFISINMISGTFSIGEIVQSLPTFTSGKFSFRLCTPNHLDGPYNNPTKVFTSDLVSFPLAQTYGLSQTTYSESSKSLNIDLNSLANPSEVNFSGYARPSMQVVGTSSGAIAEIVESILVTDETGFLTGSFFIPDPTIQTNPKFNNGTNSFSIINVSNISDRNYLSFVESSYYSSGTTNVTESTNITTRNYTIIPSQTTIEKTVTNTTSNIITQIPPPIPTPAPPAPAPTPAPTPAPAPSVGSPPPTPPSAPQLPGQLIINGVIVSGPNTGQFATSQNVNSAAAFLAVEEQLRQMEAQGLSPSLTDPEVVAALERVGYY